MVENVPSVAPVGKEFHRNGHISGLSCGAVVTLDGAVAP